MVDIETEPTTETKFEENYFEEEEENYFLTVKANTKTDPALTKPKRKPIRDLTLTDDIPAMPPKHELQDKPNDSNYEKQEKEITSKIDFHKASIKKLREKIQEEKLGVKTPEQKKALEERQLLQNELNEIKAKLDQSTQKVATVRSQLADLKNEKESISKDIDFYSLDSLNNEIKKIQDKLGYGQLSVTEEKAHIDKKRKLEGQREKIKRFIEVKKKSNELFTGSEIEFKGLAELRKKREEIKGKIKVINERFDKLKATAQGHSDNIPLLKGQIDSIDKDIQELKDKRNKLYEEWDGKWKVYNDQQYLITYIKNAEKKKENLLRSQQKQKEWEERQKEKNAVIIKETDSYGERIVACNWLIKYFSSQLVVSSETPLTKKEEVQTSKDDVKKAALKPIVKKQEEDFFALSDSNTAKKKGKKGPKTSKREQESISSGLLSIDVTLINEIKKVGLNPPVLRTDIEKFVKTLNQKLEEFTKLSVEEKNKFLQDKKAAEETNAASNNSNEAKAQVKTSSD